MRRVDALHAQIANGVAGDHELEDTHAAAVTGLTAGAAAGGAAEAALQALERLGYGTAEADRALRQALTGDGGAQADVPGLVRRALAILTTK